MNPSRLPSQISPLQRQVLISNFLSQDNQRVAETMNQNASFYSPQLDQHQSASPHVEDQEKSYKVTDKVIYLTNMALQEIPEQVLRLTGIEEISLSGNRIRSLPSDITRLSSVRHFDMSHNAITFVGSELGSLKSLLSANFSHNDLIRFSADMPPLDTLENLQLQHNQLIDLGQINLERLTRIRVLNVQENFIVQIPTYITKLSHLQELYLNSNQISCLPDEIGDISNLVVLELNKNRVNQLPTSITKLNALVRLSADFNMISTIPHAVGTMRSLSKINISNNPLSPDLIEVSRQGTFSLLKLLRALHEGGTSVQEMSLDNLRIRASDFERMANEERIKLQTELGVSRDKIQEYEHMLSFERRRNTDLTNEIYRLQQILQDPIYHIKREDGNDKYESTIREYHFLLQQSRDKERQLIEASNRKKDLLAEAVKKIENLVRRVKETEEENRNLVSEKAKLMEANRPTELGSNLTATPTEIQTSNVPTKLAELERHFHFVADRVQGIGQQVAALAYRIEFNDVSTRQAVRHGPPPTGKVSLVCVEIDSPFITWNDNPELYATHINSFNQSLRDGLSRLNGYEVFSYGYVNLVAFTSPLDAFQWCAEVLRTVSKLGNVNPSHSVVSEAESQIDASMPLFQAKIALHEGHPTVTRNIVADRFDYAGIDVQCAFTMASIANPGQFLVTANTWGLIGHVVTKESISEELIPCHLPGIENQVPMFSIQMKDLPTQKFSPLDSNKCRPSAVQQVLISIRILQESYGSLCHDIAECEGEYMNVLLGMQGLAPKPDQMSVPAELAATLSAQQSLLANRLSGVLQGKSAIRQSIVHMEAELIPKLLSERDVLNERLNHVQSYLGSLSLPADRTSFLSPRTPRSEISVEDASSLVGSTTDSYASSVASSAGSSASRTLGSESGANSTSTADLKALTVKVNAIVRKAKTTRFRSIDDANSFLKTLVDHFAKTDAAKATSKPIAEPSVERPRRSLATSTTGAIPFRPFSIMKIAIFDGQLGRTILDGAFLNHILRVQLGLVFSESIFSFHRILPSHLSWNDRWLFYIVFSPIASSGTNTATGSVRRTMSATERTQSDVAARKPTKLSTTTPHSSTKQSATPTSASRIASRLPTTK